MLSVLCKTSQQHLGHLAFFGFLQSLHTYNVHTIGIFLSIETGLLTVLPVSSEACVFACLDDWCFMATLSMFAFCSWGWLQECQRFEYELAISKVNPIEGQIEGQKSASCTAKLVRYIFYARSRAWQRLLAHSSQVFDDTSMDMMKKPRPLMSKKVICHVMYHSFSSRVASEI